VPPRRSEPTRGGADPGRVADVSLDFIAAGFDTICDFPVLAPEGPDRLAVLPAEDAPPALAAIDGLPLVAPLFTKLDLAETTFAEADFAEIPFPATAFPGLLLLELECAGLALTDALLATLLPPGLPFTTVFFPALRAADVDFCAPRSLVEGFGTEAPCSFLARLMMRPSFLVPEALPLQAERLPLLRGLGRRRVVHRKPRLFSRSSTGRLSSSPVSGVDAESTTRAPQR
jgi:hypothetical protein